MPKGIPSKKYTGEFKIKVIEDKMKHSLTGKEAADKHGVSSKTQVNRWERIYLEEGPEALSKERRGRKTGSDSPTKLDKKVEEDLIEEVQRLRAEVAYLKKLNALVHERELLERKRKQSGN